MTTSTSAIIKLLLLATVAFAKDLDQDADSSSSRLRGKIKQVVPPSSSSSSSRALVDGNNIALNQMKCVESVPIDGSVVCTFRTIPPADMNSGKTNHACLSSQAMGDKSYCISTLVYRANVNDVPVYPDPILPPPPTDPMPPAQVGGNPLMGGGIPPGIPTGTGTGKYVAVSAPTDTPVRFTSGPFFPTIINPSDCPATKPSDGVVSCEKNKSCYYYERDSAGNPTAALGCDCNGDGIFQCRTALNPIFGQQSF